MTGVVITSLPTASTLTGAEYVPVVQSGTTVKTTIANMGPVGTFTQSGTGAVTTTVQSKLRETVSVLDFGAVIGSSSASVRTANKTALINAMAAAKCVYIPEGIFWIDGDIEIPSGTMLVGAGKQATTLKGDGDLFKVSSGVTESIFFDSFQIQNDTVRGKHIKIIASVATQGIICRNVYFNTATTHFYASALIVGQYFYDCTFLDSSGFSREYGGGAYVCHEFTTYTWNSGGGILVYGKDSYTCSLNSCIFEQLQFEALNLNTGTVCDIENWTLNSCHFESVSLAVPASVPYVKLIAGTGHRLWSIQFNDCSFMKPPAGLIEFVTIVTGGGNVQGISFNGGQTFGNAYLCSNLDIVNINNILFNAGSPYVARSNQKVSLYVKSQYSSVIGATGQVNPFSTPSSEWNMDFTQNTAITIPDQGTYDLAAGSGLLAIGESSGQTMGLLFLANNAVTVVTNATSNIANTLGTAVTAGYFTVGVQYLIRTIGTTNFTSFGAASNTVGTVFTATASGTGTGTVIPVVISGSFTIGQKYVIRTIGTTNFTLIGAASNTVGTVFTATGVGTGTGTATPSQLIVSMPVGVTSYRIENQIGPTVNLCLAMQRVRAAN